MATHPGFNLPKVTTSEEFDNFDFDAFLSAKQLRKERPWTYDIIQVLVHSPGGLELQQLYRKVWAVRNPSGLPMPQAFEATIRSALNSHARHSSQWSKLDKDALFTQPNGRGTWAVDHARAAAWLEAKALPNG